MEAFRGHLVRYACGKAFRAMRRYQHVVWGRRPIVSPRRIGDERTGDQQGSRKEKLDEHDNLSRLATSCLSWAAEEEASLIRRKIRESRVRRAAIGSQIDVHQGSTGRPDILFSRVEEVVI